MMSPVVSRRLSRALRGVVATAALVGGLLVAPGQADAPSLSGPAERSSVGSSSGQRYGWGAALFDFAWEYGESLTSAPARGTRKKGRWIDASTGAGRAAHYNGGLSLDSKQDPNGGAGDAGTTALQLRGNAQTYGRWEFKRRIKTAERGGRDYRVLIELVPERGSPCSGPGITVAEVAPGRDAVTVGARPAKGVGWSYTKRARFGENPHAFAVEVAKDHITWLVDGRVVATLKNRGAIPKVPLTPRLSLVGQGQQEMRTTEVIYDWMRAWPISRGQHPRGGHALRRGTIADSC